MSMGEHSLIKISAEYSYSDLWDNPTQPSSQQQKQLQQKQLQEKHYIPPYEAYPSNTPLLIDITLVDVRPRWSWQKPLIQPPLFSQQPHEGLVYMCPIIVCFTIYLIGFYFSCFYSGRRFFERFNERKRS